MSEECRKLWMKGKDFQKCIYRRVWRDRLCAVHLRDAAEVLRDGDEGAAVELVDMTASRERQLDPLDPQRVQRYAVKRLEALGYQANLTPNAAA
jgi:hypothetical protein